MDKRTKGCLGIGLAIAVVVVMVGVAVVGGGLYWLSQHFAANTTEVPQAEAARQLDELRARFKDQQPLIAVDDAGHDARIQKEGRQATFAGELQALHIAAYDADDGKMVRFSIPFWLIRMAPDGKISIGEDALRDVRGADRLTVKELEALGPGLLIDQARPDGGRVLIWTE
jgi:hypothetical protein